MKPLSDILKGDPAPASQGEFTENGRLALQKVELAIEQGQETYVDYSQGWAAHVLATARTPTVVSWKRGPPLCLHLPVSPARALTPYCDSVACLVQLAREESRKHFGAEPSLIGVPLAQRQIDWLFRNEDARAIAFAHYPGVIDNHFPRDGLLQFVNNHASVVPRIMRPTPITDSQVILEIKKAI